MLRFYHLLNTLTTQTVHSLYPTISLKHLLFIKHLLFRILTLLLVRTCVLTRLKKTYSSRGQIEFLLFGTLLFDSVCCLLWALGIRKVILGSKSENFELSFGEYLLKHVDSMLSWFGYRWRFSWDCSVKKFVWIVFGLFCP